MLERNMKIFSILLVLLPFSVGGVTMKKQPAIHQLSADYKNVLKQKKIWGEGCPVSLERLRIVSVPYHSFESETKWGEIVVLDAVAPFVLNIFQELYDREFPIHSMRPIDAFDGSDDASMEANNSSAFNYRKIPGRGIISIHSYGLAIDVNTVQNPYMGNSFESKDKPCMLIEVWPRKGIDYMNRTHQRKGMVEPIVDVFHKFGFRDWGGMWNDLMDYHHFQTPRFLAELLAKMTSEHAIQFFEWYVDHPQVVLDDKKILADYKKDPSKFMRAHGKRLS